MKPFDYREMEFVMGSIEDTLAQMERSIIPIAEFNRMKQSIVGNKRQFEAFQAAMWTHYYHSHQLRLDSLTPEKRKELMHFGDGRPPITTEQLLNGCIKDGSHEIQKYIFAALSSNNTAFFKDYAFFIENPVRKYSKLKLWLFEICWCGDGDGWASYGTKMAPLSTTDLERLEKEHPGCQKKIYSGEELADLYQKTRGESIEISLIYRTCRELGIKTKHPKNSRIRKK